MHHPTYRNAHSTAFVIPVVKHWLERETTPFKVQSHCPGHALQLSELSKLESFVSLLDVNEKEDSVVAIFLPTAFNE